MDIKEIEKLKKMNNKEIQKYLSDELNKAREPISFGNLNGEKMPTLINDGNKFINLPNNNNKFKNKTKILENELEIIKLRN